MSLLRPRITHFILGSRWRKTYSTSIDADIRAHMLSEVKNAMKGKDTFTSTTLRSVLSEIYNADKAGDGKISSSAIVGILRKSIQRRSEASAMFMEASRPDLAEKEKRECELISKFLPSQLSEEESSSRIATKKAFGLVSREFYSQVDKSLVDSEFVRRQAKTLLNEHEQSS
ncbi:Yqey-like protein-domain-containing protein [Cyathus striatus]|nr:Yqey-like protein-domain-containing protein [Cyathus striatus]